MTRGAITSVVGLTAISSRAASSGDSAAAAVALSTGQHHSARAECAEDGAPCQAVLGRFVESGVQKSCGFIAVSPVVVNVACRDAFSGDILQAPRHRSNQGKSLNP